MTNTNKLFVRNIIILSFLLITYLVSILSRSELWSNILSPLNAFAAGGVLCFTYFKSNHALRINLGYLLCALACFAWGIADVIWAVMALIGAEPENSPIIWITYLLTNIFLISTLFLFAVEQFRKWDLVQFCVDLVINGIMNTLMFWLLFLHKDMSILSVLFTSDFTSLLSIFIDILIFISVSSWFLSIRTGQIPAFMYILATGMVLFGAVDIIYYYLDYTGLYSPNYIIDFLYIAALCTLAFGALWKLYKNSILMDFSVVKNTGKRKRWPYLFIYPVITVIFAVTGLTNTTLTGLDMAAFIIPIFLYWSFCKYIQVSLEKEALLKHQNEILEQRVAEQVSELTFLANQDTLTTLFNRRYFITTLDHTLQSRHPNDLLAILMLDLDRFKTINDTYGHDVGDQLLVELSYRMIEWNNYGATFARLGGDEFAVLFSGKYTQRDIDDFSKQIIDICTKPIEVGNMTLHPTMSVGIAMFTENAPDWKTLMKQADMAMYSAKAQGYNKHQFYDLIIDQNFKQNVEIESLLNQANVETDFQLYYQPQYSLPELELIGAEALIRWDNKDHGFIPPNIFIPIAEKIEYIFKLGKWVLRETVRQAESWNTTYPAPMKIGFNISPKQFGDEGFIRLFEALLSDRKVNPEWIDAEITESVMMTNEAHADEIFEQLKKFRVSISLDDFGTGYSALSHITKYPFDRIKLDKSLTSDISNYNSKGINIVKAAIDMAHSAGIKTIAEGVETKEQLEILKTLGCDQVQGYFLGRPVPADVFEQRYIISDAQSRSL